MATGCTSSSTHTCHILATWFLPSVRADKPSPEAQHSPSPAPRLSWLDLVEGPLLWAVLGMWLLDAGVWQAGRLAGWQVAASGLPRTFDTLPYKPASWNAELRWLYSKRATNWPSLLCRGCEFPGLRALRRHTTLLILPRPVVIPAWLSAWNSEDQKRQWM